MPLSAREIKEKDFDLVADDWQHSNVEFMKGMGVYVSKILANPYTRLDKHCTGG